MKRKFFVQYFIGFLRPLLIFILIFSVSSFVILWAYSTRFVNKANTDLLTLTKANIEQVLNESISLLYALDKNIRTRMEMKDFFSTEAFSYEKLREYKDIMDTLNVSTNVHKNLHSIYLYLENPYSIFLASKYGQAKLGSYPDSAWYGSYTAHPDAASWVERRQLRSYAFLSEPEPVITLYQRFDYMQGTIVLNIPERFFSELTRERGAFQDQHFAIVNEASGLVFSTWAGMPAFLPGMGSWGDADNQIVNVDGTRYVLAAVYSPEYNWHYVSMVPVYSAYRVPYTMLMLIGAALAAAVLIGAVVSYYQARKHYAWLEGIVNLLIAAERDGRTPDFADEPDNIYAVIVQNVARVFREGNNLKLQVIRHKLAEEKTELRALQQQLNPHFIYNTLEYINQQMLSTLSHPTAVNAMVQDLSKILRYALDTPERTIPFYEEYENTQRYINIMRHRYEDKLQVSWRLQPDIMEYSVLKFILQLLVENAIKHGLKYPKTSIYIRISVREGDDGNLHINVLDTGLGIGRRELAKLRADIQTFENAGHIGLNNLNRRLMLAYNGQYRLSIISSRGRGTSIKLVIPLAFHDPGA